MGCCFFILNYLVYLIVEHYGQFDPNAGALSETLPVVANPVCISQ